jgi:hypothetical protein
VRQSLLTTRSILKSILLLVAVILLLPGVPDAQPGRTRPGSADVPVDPSWFTVARLHYGGGGDWYWGSSAIPNLLKFVEENTNIPVSHDEVRVRPSESRLFSYPFVYATGHGNIRLSDDDLTNMRRYLTNGGFWFISDSYGMDESVRRELKRVFPDRALVELPYSHALYQTPYQFPDGPPKIHEHDSKPPRGYAILDGDRVVVYYLFESDIGDGWEDPQVHNDSPQKRQDALQMGTNIIVYSLTH